MRDSLAVVGVTAAAAACCGLAPAVIAGVGGVSLAVVLGWGALVIAAIAVGALIVARQSRMQSANRSDER